MPEIPPATAKQQKYLDLASHYVGRARLCYEKEMWPEAATHFGSALESLLRIRYGSNKKLGKMIAAFDRDSLFDEIFIHDGTTRCITCVADSARIMRNAVHPDCWKEASQRDVDLAQALVTLIYHVIVVCQSGIAVFQDSPDPTLKALEATRTPIVHASAPEPHVL